MKHSTFVYLIGCLVIGSHHVSCFSTHIPQPLTRRVDNSPSSFQHHAFEKNSDRRQKLWETTTTLRGGAIAIPGLGPVNHFLGSNPFAAAFVICAIKAMAADAVAQKSEKPLEMNLRRNMAFFLYGGAYQGCFQEFMYNGIFPKVFGSGVGIITAVKKVSFDMMVITPFLCLPIAYIIKAVIFGQTLRDGVTKYVHDIKENKLLKKYWSLWTPVQLMTFSIVPEHLRITFIACVSFFWLILLSSISARSMTPAKASA